MGSSARMSFVEKLNAQVLRRRPAYQGAGPPRRSAKPSTLQRRDLAICKRQAFGLQRMM
jgi:hypothetical protein